MTEVLRVRVTYSRPRMIVALAVGALFARRAPLRIAEPLARWVARSVRVEVQ